MEGKTPLRGVSIGASQIVTAPLSPKRAGHTAQELSLPSSQILPATPLITIVSLPSILPAPVMAVMSVLLLTIVQAVAVLPEECPCLRRIPPVAQVTHSVPLPVCLVRPFPLILQQIQDLRLVQSLLP